MQRQELEGFSREQLIAHAERLGVPRPRVLTQPELIDEIIGRTATNERDKAKARGWLGRARDLLSRVVERGLHLPEAARALRSPSSSQERAWPSPPPPLPTVTLAEIYAAQGHFERALAVLDEVLARDPDHREARALKARFAEKERARARPSRGAAIEAEPSAAPQARSPAAPAPMTEKPDAGTEAAQPATTVAMREEVARREAPAAKASEARPRAEAKATAREAQATAREAQATAREAQATAKAAPRAEAPAAPARLEEREGPLDEAALPERYNVDEIVAIAVDPRTIYLYWEVRATTLARAQARRPDGLLGVRIVGVIASWSGPVVQIRDLRVDALYGDRFVHEVEPGSNVRVSVGWKAGGDFEPFAVGVEVTVPHLVPMESISQEVAVWMPSQSRPADPPHAIPSDEIATSAGAVAAAMPRFAPPKAEPQPRLDHPAPPRASRRAPSEAPIDSGIAVWTSVVPGSAREITTGEVNELRQLGETVEVKYPGNVVEVRRLGNIIEIKYLGSVVRFSGTGGWLEVGDTGEWVEVGDTDEWVEFDEVIASYVSQWLHLGGASELGRGASELMRRGASNLYRRGASNLYRRGASELVRRGASELVRRGASNLYRIGASELVRRGASNLYRIGTSTPRAPAPLKDRL
jgi:hypothetical protein